MFHEVVWTRSYRSITNARAVLILGVPTDVYLGAHSKRHRGPEEVLGKGFDLLKVLVNGVELIALHPKYAFTHITKALDRRHPTAILHFHWEVKSRHCVLICFSAVLTSVS